jgi:hypothetical protein
MKIIPTGWFKIWTQSFSIMSQFCVLNLVPKQHVFLFHFYSSLLSRMCDMHQKVQWLWRKPTSRFWWTYTFWAPLNRNFFFFLVCHISVCIDGSACHMLSRWFLARLILRPRRWRRYVPPKRRLTFNGLHGVISQKIVLFSSGIVGFCVWLFHLVFLRCNLSICALHFFPTGAHFLETFCVKYVSYYH